ncbi:uncharacterized protein LOC143247899 [Tachypleus tridentatus]|uniref:uncharacterized protein LOC143247899 n=1 Tax=Tachypleus tridentatus TaxID=6853 RepID=UPI003FD2CD73
MHLIICTINRYIYVGRIIYTQLPRAVFDITHLLLNLLYLGVNIKSPLLPWCGTNQFTNLRAKRHLAICRIHQLESNNDGRLGIWKADARYWIEQNIVENEMLNEIDELKVSVVDIEDEDRVRSDILYSVDEVPRWYLCIILGIQQFLMMFGSTLAYSYLVTPKLCIQETDPARSYITSTIFLCQV